MGHWVKTLSYSSTKTSTKIDSDENLWSRDGRNVRINAVKDEGELVEKWPKLPCLR